MGDYFRLQKIASCILASTRMRRFLSRAVVLAVVLTVFAATSIVCGQQPENGACSTSSPPNAAPTTPKQSSSVPEDGGRKSLRLIDKLVDVSEPGPGYSHYGTCGRFCPLHDAEPPSRFYPRPSGPWELKSAEAIRELVSIGADAVPELIAHLGDKRKTKLPPIQLGEGPIREYDYNRRTTKEAPKSVVHPDGSWFNTETLDVPELDTDGHLVQPVRAEESVPNEDYVVRVGDLCFVALGQIVNREFNAVRYQPENWMVIVPPSHSRALRAAIEREWGGLTREKLKASLIADVREPDKAGRELTALERISFYYPECVDKLALELIQKPHYDIFLIWKFAPVLYQTESKSERRRLFDEFVKKNGKPFADGLLLQLVV